MLESFAARMLLIRHGEPQSTALTEESTIIADAENALTAFGRCQISVLARECSTTLLPSQIAFSPLRRARETADVFAAEFPDTLALCDARLEERRFRFPATFTYADSRSHQILAFEHPDQNIVGGESVDEHRSRCVDWLGERMKFWRAQAVPTTELVICHGGTIEHLLFTVLGMPTSKMFWVYCDLPCGGFHDLTCTLHKDAFVWRINGLCKTNMSALS